MQIRLQEVPVTLQEKRAAVAKRVTATQSIGCPSCGAVSQEPCWSLNSVRPRSKKTPHTERHLLARAQKLI